MRIRKVRFSGPTASDMPDAPMVIEFSMGALIPAALISLFTTLRFGVRDGLTITALLILCLIGHELGHILTARLSGVTVKSLGFCHRGSYIRRVKAPNPRTEMMIAMAGPLANFAIAMLCWQWGGLVHWLGTFNFVVFFSNLVPIKNSDGLRILQSARQMARERRLAASA